MRWDRLTVARSTVLTLAGLAALVYGAFLLAEVVGFAVLGVALLVLEWLTRPEEKAQR
jgi:membrane protein DedA with SNARE-associated domain